MEENVRTRQLIIMVLIVLSREERTMRWFDLMVRSYCGLAGPLVWLVATFLLSSDQPAVRPSQLIFKSRYK